MSEDTLQQDANRGSLAKQILSNELWEDTWKYLDQSYVDAWGNCKTTELREEAWRLRKSLEKLKGHFETVLSNGILASRQIEELVAAAKRRRAA